MRVGDTIENPVTGESMTFLVTGNETGGEYLEIAMTVQPRGFVASEHLHPHQHERFRIDAGEITLRIAGREQVYRAGDDVTIPPGTPHIWWNSGQGALQVRLEFRPAGRFDQFITSFFALAQAGKVNARGLPRNPLQLAVTAREYTDVIRGTDVPAAVQTPLLAVLGSIGTIMGYRANVPYPARTA
jgi:quercetin dioxygenase-like cupin family protein